MWSIELLINWLEWYSFIIIQVFKHQVIEKSMSEMWMFWKNYSRQMSVVQCQYYSTHGRCQYCSVGWIAGIRDNRLPPSRLCIHVTWIVLRRHMDVSMKWKLTMSSTSLTFIIFNFDKNDYHQTAICEWTCFKLIIWSGTRILIGQLLILGVNALARACPPSFSARFRTLAPNIPLRPSC